MFGRDVEDGGIGSAFYLPMRRFRAGGKEIFARRSGRLDMKAVVCLALCQEIIKRRMVGVTPLVVYRVYIIKKCRDMKPLRAAQQGGHALLFNGVLIVIDTVQRKTFLCELDSSHYAPELVQPFLRGERMKQQGRQQRRRVVIRLHEILHRKNVEPPRAVSAKSVV